MNEQQEQTKDGPDLITNLRAENARLRQALASIKHVADTIDEILAIAVLPGAKP